jgi:hypothetical protein
MLIWDAVSGCFGLAHEHLYLDQCYNPCAQECSRAMYLAMLPDGWIELYWHEHPVWPRSDSRPVSRHLQHNWALAFSEQRDPSLSVCRPEQMTVLCWIRSPNIGNLASDHCDKVWAFRPIRAAALESYLRVVRTLLRPSLYDNMADIIVAHLADWHAALPHANRAALGSFIRCITSALNVHQQQQDTLVIVQLEQTQQFEHIVLNYSQLLENYSKP